MSSDSKRVCSKWCLHFWIVEMYNFTIILYHIYLENKCIKSPLTNKPQYLFISCNNNDYRCTVHRTLNSSAVALKVFLLSSQNHWFCCSIFLHNTYPSWWTELNHYRQHQTGSTSFCHPSWQKNFTKTYEAQCVVRYWRGYLSGPRYTWFIQLMPLPPHHLLLQ